MSAVWAWLPWRPVPFRFSIVPWRWTAAFITTAGGDSIRLEERCRRAMGRSWPFSPGGRAFIPRWVPRPRRRTGFFSGTIRSSGRRFIPACPVPGPGGLFKPAGKSGAGFCHPASGAGAVPPGKKSGAGRQLLPPRLHVDGRSVARSAGVFEQGAGIKKRSPAIKNLPPRTERTL